MFHGSLVFPTAMTNVVDYTRLLLPRYDRTRFLLRLLRRCHSRGKHQRAVSYNVLWSSFGRQPGPACGKSTGFAGCLSRGVMSRGAPCHGGGWVVVVGGGPAPSRACPGGLPLGASRGPAIERGPPRPPPGSAARVAQPGFRARAPIPAPAPVASSSWRRVFFPTQEV